MAGGDPELVERGELGDMGLWRLVGDQVDGDKRYLSIRVRYRYFHSDTEDFQIRYSSFDRFTGIERNLW